MKSPRDRILLLDGARGLAALSIVLFHLYSSENRIINSFWVFVDFFFVLSGFVLYSSIRRISDSRDLKSFILNRAIRLIPMSYTALLFVISIQLLVNLKYMINRKPLPESIPLDILTLILAFTFMQVISINAQLLLYPLWSLSVEWITNLIAAIAAKKTKFHINLIFVLPGLSLLAIHYLGDVSGLLESVLNQLGRGLLSFGLGLLIARYRFTQLPFKNSILGVVFIVISILLSIRLSMIYSEWSSLVTPFLFAISIYYINSIDEHRLSPSLLLSCKQLGRWSYGIYVWHVVAANVVSLGIENRVLDGVALNMFLGVPKLLLVVSMTLIFTELTLRFIETPLRMKFRRG